MKKLLFIALLLLACLIAFLLYKDPTQRQIDSVMEVYDSMDDSTFEREMYKGVQGDLSSEQVDSIQKNL